jgi:hypothetical protein
MAARRSRRSSSSSRRRSSRRKHGDVHCADHLRTVRFAPYLKGMGPTFTLTTWDTNRLDRRHSPYIRYQLTMSDKGKTSVLFKGDDFSCGPMHSIDSDECVRSLMGFLTLRPGDTDREYFRNYTPKQLDYTSKHAEALDLAVMDRFGEG